MRTHSTNTRLFGLTLALTLAVSCGPSADSETTQSATPAKTQQVIPDLGPWAEGSTIPSGVAGAPDLRIIKLDKNGSGPVCGLGKKAKVKYKAMLADGTVRDPGQRPYEFVVGTSPVIGAWHTIVSHMRVGDSFTVQIPEAVVDSEGPKYANMGDWVFEMELLSVR